MSLIKNYTVLFGSCFVILGSLAWGVAEGGYEPWIVAAAGVVGILTNWDLLPTLRRSKRILTPEQKIEKRDKWRPVFQDYFLVKARNESRTDTIIHDVDRMDIYPNSGEERGISPWFRVGLMGTYNKGILLGLRWTHLEQKDGTWVETSKGESEDSIKVALIGEVPYEAIETVNFEGDEYYNKPHIFCHFDYSGEPYQRLFYGEEFQLDPGFPHHYREIAEYERPASSWWRNLRRR